VESELVLKPVYKGPVSVISTVESLGLNKRDLDGFFTLKFGPSKLLPSRDLIDGTTNAINNEASQSGSVRESGFRSLLAGKATAELFHRLVRPCKKDVISFARLTVEDESAGTEDRMRGLTDDEKSTVIKLYNSADSAYTEQR
jgi:hypothetical protein